MKYIVDIHGEINGDYEIIKKYDEPKTGSWIKQGYDGVCTVCYKHTMLGHKYKYCPHCGSDNGGEQRESK